MACAPFAVTSRVPPEMGGGRTEAVVVGGNVGRGAMGAASANSVPPSNDNALLSGSPPKVLASSSGSLVPLEYGDREHPAKAPIAPQSSRPTGSEASSTDVGRMNVIRGGSSTGHSRKSITHDFVLGHADFGRPVSALRIGGGVEKKWP